MEDTLRDIMTKSEFASMLIVLILVLMEDTLRDYDTMDELFAAWS